MLRLLTTLLVVMSLLAGLSNAQTVQAGVDVSGTSLVISAKPDAALTGNLSGGNVTIVWPTGYSITLGAVTSAVGVWALQGSGTSGASTWQDYAVMSIATPINWGSGSVTELFRVAVNQTGTAGTGTLALGKGVRGAGGWYLEVGGFDKTNYGTSFYGSSVAAVPLPVELTTFTATCNRLSAELKWSTAKEIENYGFDIERRAEFGKDTLWTKVGFVSGNGSSNTPHDYSYTDSKLSSGRYAYRLKQVDLSETYRYYQTTEVEIGLAAKVLSLSNNYPNPFNPSTNIEFTLPSDGRVVLKVYNILGQEVAELFNGEGQAGRILQARFDATRLSSGLYFYQLQFGGKSLIKRMTLMK